MYTATSTLTAPCNDGKEQKRGKYLAHAKACQVSCCPPSHGSSRAVEPRGQAVVGVGPPQGHASRLARPQQGPRVPGIQGVDAPRQQLGSLDLGQGTAGSGTRTHPSRELPKAPFVGGVGGGQGGLQGHCRGAHVRQPICSCTTHSWS